VSGFLDGAPAKKVDCHYTVQETRYQTLERSFCQLQKAVLVCSYAVSISVSEAELAEIWLVSQHLFLCLFYHFLKQTKKEKKRYLSILTDK